jgi:four helix bundle protein
MTDHRKLDVWRRAQALAVRIDRETRNFGRGYAELADQIRRASLSIATHLAEGAARARDGEFLRFIVIAIGSAAEVDSLLTHAVAVGAMNHRAAAEVEEELVIVRKQLHKLRGAVRPKSVVREAHEIEPDANSQSPFSQAP